MPALRAGGHLMHALHQQNRVAVNLNGSVAGLERVESQPAGGDRGDEHCLRRAHPTIVGAYEVVGVQPSERRCIRADQRRPERIVYGANAPADGVGVARRPRVTLRVASADSTGEE